MKDAAKLPKANKAARTPMEVPTADSIPKPIPGRFSKRYPENDMRVEDENPERKTVTKSWDIGSPIPRKERSCLISSRCKSRRTSTPVCL